ncbi:MAG TPA: PAS domain S-box protein [Paludibacter sp.]|nr:PAS domain S-box protein [Paludibacter sp.]
MKPSNTSAADTQRHEAEKLASNNNSNAGVNLTNEEALLRMQRLELRIAELEVQNKDLSNIVEEQKQTEATLQKSKILLNLIIKTIPDLIWLKDVNGTYLACNTMFECFFGAKEADVMGKTDYDFVSKELADFFRNNDNLAMLAGMPTTNEEWITFANDGHSAFLETIKTPMSDENNKIIGILGIGRDITLRKKAESQLHEKEVQYLNLANSGLALVWTSGTDKLCNYFNQTWCNFTGRALEQEMGNGWTENIFPEDFDQCLSTYVTAFDKRKPFQIEYRLRHHSGEYRWILDMGTPNYNSAGEFIGYIGNCVDINERKKTENALEESETKYRELVEYSPDAIAIYTKKGIVFVNKECLHIMHAEAKEKLIGLNPIEIVHPDYRSIVSERMKMVFLGNKVLSLVEEKFIRLDGTTIDVEVKAIPLKYENKPAVQLIVRDITERKLLEEKLRRSEEKLSSLFASMTEMVVTHELIFDENGNAVNYQITDCNTAFTGITGIERQDAVGKLATEVYGTESAPYLEQYAQVAITGESIEFDSYFAPLDKHFLISAISPEKNKFATIATDVTILQQVQLQISNKNKELEDYLYITSHDLRTPLVNIQGFSQRLQKQTDNIKSQLTDCEMDAAVKRSIDKITTEDIPKTLDFVFSSVTKMETLINGLLQLSRTGRIKMSIDKVDMNKLIKTVLIAHNFQMSELSASINIESLPDCYGDEQQLNQLFANLISNAIKYRDINKQFAIKINAIHTFNRVIYSITDNGIGIAPKHHDKIWNIFYRVNPQSQILGDGVGLNVVKQIAEKHHGKVWVESEKGQGSTFFVELQKNSF